MTSLCSDSHKHRIRNSTWKPSPDISIPLYDNQNQRIKISHKRFTMSEQNADQTGSVGAAAATVVEQQRQQLQPSASSHRPSRILFGSCSSQSYSEQPLWSAILARNATAWVWGGDAIYAGMWCVAQRERNIKHFYSHCSYFFL